MMQETPELLYDIYQNFGEDLSFSAINDLRIVSESERSKQRVLRRLLTSIRGYIWHPEYGAGLPAFVGTSRSSDRSDQIKSLILSQIFLEPSVALTPEPKIIFQTIQDGIFVQINYTESTTKQPIVLNFDISQG
jgi:hypothetical protein